MIYADFNGSAPLCGDVKEYLINRIQNDGPYANPNAIHSLGQKVKGAMEKCRYICADLLGAQMNQVIFNSGSSEGISHIFHSCLFPVRDKKVIITSGIEHSAVINGINFYCELGYQKEVIKTLPNGQVDLNHFQELMKNHKNNIALVTVMAANNETGVIQPINEIAKTCNDENVTVFSDTTQFIGKDSFNFAKSGLDFALLSGHKIGALVGSGLILAKNPEELTAHVFGGGQEFGQRGGTQNYIGVETLAVALKSFEKKVEKLSHVKKLRENFEKSLQSKYKNLVVMGQESPRLASTTYMSYPGIHGQAVQIELESHDIFVTTSSACSDNEPSTSKVLKAMGMNDAVGRGAVRISLCCGAEEEHYKKIEDALDSTFRKLAKIESY